MNNEIEKALKFDPLASAKEITGKSYKDCKGTSALGMLLAIEHNKFKREILETSGDISHCSSLEHFESVMKGMGFKVVLEETFKGRDNQEELLQIWWEDTRGILASMNTFTCGDRRSLNSCKFYGNVAYNENVRKYTSSGGMKALTPEIKEREENYFSISCARSRISGYNNDREKDVTNQQIAAELGISVEEVQAAIDNRPSLSDWAWVGDWHHERIRHNINGIDQCSKWMRKWTKRPFLWLLAYTESDNEDYEYNAINEARIARLPSHVRECITPTED